MVAIERLLTPEILEGLKIYGSLGIWEPDEEGEEVVEMEPQSAACNGRLF